MANQLKELTSKEFDSEVQSGATLVDFWAPWCAPCRAQIPILEKIAGELNGKASIAKVNVDSEIDLAQRFGVQSIPTMILFKDGEVLQHFVGVQREATLVDALENAV
jgi:thioredoxin 1